MASNNKTAPSQFEGIHRATPIATYEATLREVRWSARAIGFFLSSARFIALCILVWATVVLLSAFASFLLPLDLSLICSLLLLETLRLSSSSFSTHLLSHSLARLSQDPKFIHHSKDIHYQRARLVRFVLHFLQFLLILPSFITPLFRLPFLHSSYRTNPQLNNLFTCISIFYILTAINAAVSFITLICSAIVSVSLSKNPEQSFLRYYDKILENTLKVGVVQADNFGFLPFAYQMLAGEFERNVQPEAVAKNHRELLRYMFMHRHGVDFLQIYLDASDAFAQTAAANMVAMWADPDWGLGLELKLPDDLLTKLADKLGTGQVGWAAANSIGRLARTEAGAQLIAATVTSRGQRLVDRLADMVDVSSSRSLVFVRTLVFFYQKISNEEKQPPVSPFQEPEKLVSKLKLLLQWSKVHRLRVQSAYLLLMMGKLRFDEFTLVQAIRPYEDAYWFNSEVSGVCKMGTGFGWMFLHFDWENAYGALQMRSL